jgi:tetratricopeptide (TPR) repeat protein
MRALQFLSSMGLISLDGNRIRLASTVFRDYALHSSAHGLAVTRRQCAQYLERTTENPEVLVEAWDLAGEAGKTLQYAQEASTHARLRGDLASDVSHLRRGLRHARGGTQEAQFQSLLGTALLAAREVNEAASLLRAASASAWALGDASHWLELQVRLIDAEGHGSGADAVDSAARLLDVAKTALRQGCVYPAAKALDRSLHYCHRAGDDQGAVTVFRQAEEILRCTSDRKARAFLHGTLAMKAYYGDPDSGLKHAALAVRAADAACSVPERFHVLNRRLAVLLATGRLRCEEGRATIREALTLSEASADLLQRAHLQINIAVWDADCGNWTNASRQLEALIPHLRNPDDKRPLVLALCNLGLASLRCGKFVEATKALEEGEALLTNWDSQEVRAQFAAGLGWVALERGQMRQAREQIAYLDSLTLPSATDISTIALFRARYLRRCGQLETALDLLSVAIRETEKRFPVHHIA